MKNDFFKPRDIVCTCAIVDEARVKFLEKKYAKEIF